MAIGVVFRDYIFAYVCLFATPSDRLPYECVDTAFDSPIIREYHNGEAFPLPWERKSGTMVMGEYLANGEFLVHRKVSYSSADYSTLENTSWLVISIDLVVEPNVLFNSGLEETFYEFSGLPDV